MAPHAAVAPSSLEPRIGARVPAIVLILLLLPARAFGADSAPVDAWSGRLEVQRVVAPYPTAVPSQVPLQFVWTRSGTAIECNLADDASRARRVGGASLATLAVRDPEYHYLHFAAHGYHSTQVPALGSLVLNQVGNAPTADCFVTAVERPAFSLASDLIVLSACDPEVGDVAQGEGAMGLPDALFATGNRNTLLTLWPIIDPTTTEFVKKFFARTARGEPQARLLTGTKCEFLAWPLARPVFWAGFVLYGN